MRISICVGQIGEKDFLQIITTPLYYSPNFSELAVLACIKGHVAVIV